MSTKRSSTARPAGPKPPVNFSSTLCISEKAVLQGTHSIAIQSESVVHPGAKFESAVGSIFIGRRCIINERAHIGAYPEDLDTAKPGGVILGDYVIIEADVVIESGNTEIGDGSVVQAGSRIGTGAKIGKNCTLTPRSIIKPGEDLPDDTVVYANGLRRTDRRGLHDLRKKGLTKQISMLHKMIPSNPVKFQS